MYCSWLQFDKKRGLQLSAFKEYFLEHAHQLTIYHHLKKFIGEYNLANSFLSIALSSPLMQEEFVRLSKASPQPLDFQLKHFQPLLWNYQYLRALDDGNHLFYVNGIKKTTHFEYQLLAHKAQLKLITFTSTYAAQLAAYVQLQGKAFRHTKLSLDLEKVEYNIAACLNRDALARMLYMHSQPRDQNPAPHILAAMIGSYYMELRTL
jgi:hypothetical protein